MRSKRPRRTVEEGRRPEDTLRWSNLLEQAQLRPAARWSGIVVAAMDEDVLERAVGEARQCGAEERR